MLKKITLFLFTILSIHLSAQIDTVTLTFTPEDGGNPVIVSATSGSYGFMPSGMIDLLESTVYQLEISLGSQDSNFMAMQDEVQFFFTLSSEELIVGAVEYNDQDNNNLPIGFDTKLRTECKEMDENGLFRIFFRELGTDKDENVDERSGFNIFDISWIINVLNDPNAPGCENEEEIITDVVLTFIPEGGGEKVVARAQDPDGEGVFSLEILDTINLLAGTEYTMGISLANSIEGEDITEEIMEEDDEHQFFFAWTDGVFSDPNGDGNVDNQDDAVNYIDFDENNLPVGLSTRWTASSMMSNGGSFRVILKHQPDVKSATSTVNDGGTDIDLTWVLNIQNVTNIREQQVLNRDLSVFPNPSRGILNWQLDQGAPLKDVEIRVFDHFGRFLFQEQRVDGELDISRLTSGQYILQIKTADAIRITRFVKQ